MAKVIVMPDGNWLSHVSRPLEIAKALRARGHWVLFGASGEYTRLASEAGFEVLPVETLDPEHVLRCSRSGRANWWGAAELERLVAADREILDRVEPDIVLTDFRLSLPTSCELAGVPLAMVLNAAWTNHYAVRTRAPEHLPVTRLFGRRLSDAVAPLLKRWILSADARPFRRFRRRLGLAPRGNIWDQWRGDLNLMVDTPQYAPTRNLPPGFHYIGPIPWEPEGQAPGFLRRLDTGKPTVYVTMGSTGNAEFFGHAIDLVRDGSCNCVITTAGLAQLTDLPPNVFAIDYAPGSSIMAVADVVICHGGNGTIYQAMAHGVPIIGIPTMHDQEFNLDRVVDLGLGLHLSELRFRPGALRDALNEVLHNDRYRRAAAVQAEVLRQYDGPRRGAELIEQQVAR